MHSTPGHNRSTDPLAELLRSADAGFSSSAEGTASEGTASDGTTAYASTSLSFVAIEARAVKMRMTRNKRRMAVGSVACAAMLWTLLGWSGLNIDRNAKPLVADRSVVESVDQVDSPRTVAELQAELARLREEGDRQARFVAMLAKNEASRQSHTADEESYSETAYETHDEFVARMQRQIEEISRQDYEHACFLWAKYGDRSIVDERLRAVISNYRDTTWAVAAEAALAHLQTSL